MRTIFNLLIATALLFAFNTLGWLTLNYDGSPIKHLSWAAFGNILLVAMAMWLVGHLVNLLYLIASCLTAGLLLLVYPIVGWITLSLTAYFMPGTLTLHGFWLTLICGILLMVVKIHRRKTETTATVTSAH